jgi:hypothetical protein
MASGIGASSTQNRLSRLLCPAITRDLQVCSASVRTIGPAMRLVLDRSVVSVRCRDAFRRGTMTLVPISITGGSSNPSGNARIGPIALADLGNDVLVEQEFTVISCHALARLLEYASEEHLGKIGAKTRYVMNPRSGFSLGSAGHGCVSMPYGGVPVCGAAGRRALKRPVVPLCV